MKKLQKWPHEKRDELTRLCMAGKMSNKELAMHFDVPLTEIHAARSALGITIDKCKAAMNGANSIPIKTPSVIDLGQVSTRSLIRELGNRKVVKLVPAEVKVLLLNTDKAYATYDGEPI